MKRIYPFLLALVSVLAAHAQLPQINLLQVGTGFSRPVDIQNCGDDRIFIVEKLGRIRIMSKSGAINTTPFLDIQSQVLSSGNEQGLLGLAFSPNFKQDGYFYVNYINGTGSGSTRISRFSVMANDSNQADPNSEVILLTFTQPYTNHNGGSVRFGPDGYLYDSQGDGGSQYDPNGNGQNTNVYLAKILRLDVNGQSTYAIPPTNPFAGQSNVKQEIWAYGCRNPWRVSFDRITGDLWIGDVGQGAREEIDFAAKGDTGGHNYGWRCREGSIACSSCIQTGCPTSGFTDPILEYTHNNGNCSVTGGYVYRGVQYASLWGRYLFTDYCSGQFWSLKQTGPNTFDPDTLQDFSNNSYMSFGQDNVGEMYVSAENGKIYRIVETTNCNPVAFISFKDSVELCAGEKLTALKGDTVTYQWYDANGMINGATANELTVPANGWYKVQVSKAQGGCQAISDSIYVTVHQPDALVPCNCNASHCINSAPVSIANLFSPSGGSYSGFGIANDTLYPATAGVGADTIDYFYTNQYGCVSAGNAILQVNDVTALSVDSTNIPFCAADQSPLALDGFITPAGGTYTGTGISNNSFSTQAAGQYTALYTYTNNAGCISQDSLSILAAICEGINDLASDLKLAVSPNPNKGNFGITLTSEKRGVVDLQLVDVLGRVCWQKQLALNTSPYTINVDGAALAKGTYQLVVSMNGKRMTNKIVVE